MSADVSWLDQETLLRRSGRPQNTIHHRDCRHIEGKRSIPWIYAETASAAEIASATANGLHFCKTCKPMDWVRERKAGQ